MPWTQRVSRPRLCAKTSRFALLGSCATSAHAKKTNVYDPRRHPLKSVKFEESALEHLEEKMAAAAKKLLLLTCPARGSTTACACLSGWASLRSSSPSVCPSPSRSFAR